MVMMMMMAEGRVQAVIPLYFHIQAARTSTSTISTTQHSEQSSTSNAAAPQQGAGRKSFLWQRISRQIARDSCSSSSSLDLPVSVTPAESSNGMRDSSASFEFQFGLDTHLTSPRKDDGMMKDEDGDSDDDDEERPRIVQAVVLPRRCEKPRLDSLPWSTFPAVLPQSPKQQPILHSPVLHLPTYLNQHHIVPPSPAPSSSSSSRSFSSSISSRFRSSATRLDCRIREAFSSKSSSLSSNGKETSTSRVLTKRKKQKNQQQQQHSAAVITLFGIRVDRSRVGECFGRPLVREMGRMDSGVVEDEDPVTGRDCQMFLPVIARRCLEYLDQIGLKEEGIYRVPGRLIETQQLRMLFDAGQDVDLRSIPLRDLDPHAVCSLLKLWLREIPVSLLSPYCAPRIESLIRLSLGQSATSIPLHPPFSPSHAAVQPPSIIPSADLLNELAFVFIHDLSAEYWTLLRALCYHLARVAEQEKVNKMSMKNLRLILSPTLGLSPMMLLLLIENRQLLFGNGNDDIQRRRTQQSESTPVPQQSRYAQKPARIVVLALPRRRVVSTSSSFCSPSIEIPPIPLSSALPPTLRPFSHISLDPTTLAQPLAPLPPLPPSASPSTTPISDYFSSTNSSSFSFSSSSSHHRQNYFLDSSPSSAASSLFHFGTEPFPPLAHRLRASSVEVIGGSKYAPVQRFVHRYSRSEGSQALNPSMPSVPLFSVIPRRIHGSLGRC